ncbi:hypothetical protein Bpfe_026283, partial [Biomphalaria pfeifferi]
MLGARVNELRPYTTLTVTTLHILSAFTPAYFTIIYGEIRMLLLMAGVVVNHGFTFFFPLRHQDYCRGADEAGQEADDDGDPAHSQDVKSRPRRKLAGNLFAR